MLANSALFANEPGFYGRWLTGVTVLVRSSSRSSNPRSNGFLGTLILGGNGTVRTGKEDLATMRFFAEARTMDVLGDVEYVIRVIDLVDSLLLSCRGDKTSPGYDLPHM